MYQVAPKHTAQCKKKNDHSVFVIFWKLCQNVNKKTIFLSYFGPLKANYRSFMPLLTLHCFFLTLITLFFIFLAPYVPICLYYFLILCFYFHLLSHPGLATRHILQFIMLASISLQRARNISEIKNTS